MTQTRTSKPVGYWQIAAGTKYIVHHNVALPVDALRGEIKGAVFLWHRAEYEIKTAVDEPRQCSKCREMKPSDEFFAEPSRRGRGLTRFCRDCSPRRRSR